MEITLQNEVKREKRRRKILIWSAGILIGSLFIIAVGLYAYIIRAHPTIAGEIQLSGLQEKVEVIRDEHGVPHIHANNEEDLYLAQGYTQAQDRLFQMDLSRRQASGQLSEVVGEAALNNDKYFLTLGLRRAAEASYEQYSETAKQVLAKFAEGVNLYIDELRENGKWPLEFKLLGYEPEDWSPIDSLTIGKYMAFDLGGHWESQAFRYYLLQNFSEEKALDLFPTYPEEAPYIIGKDELNIENSFAQAVIPHEYNGSNNWVVSGTKTASGKPILADDPHLSLSTPSIWYQMHLEAPTVNVSGVIFAGIPGIILGHNEQIAWGVTNTGPDVQDLYIEKRNPDSPYEFLYNDQWEKATVIKNKILVKDKDPVEYEVVVTRHGPVVSEFAADSGKATVLSLQWTALEPSSELEAVLNMNKAGSWEEFEEALEGFHTPAQNFVFASTDGTIAYKANGKIPIRKKGNGLLPAPGWTDEYGWVGYIPYDKLPRTVNPEDGFISTANNKVVGDDYPYHISHDWAQGYRQMRIQEVLSSTEQIEVEDMMHLQMDQLNIQAREFVPPFIDLLQKSSNNKVSQALSILKEWDYIDSPEQAAPLLFNLWMDEIAKVLFEKEISQETLDLFRGKRQAVDQLLRRAIEGTPGPWIEEHKGIINVLEKSLLRVIANLESQQGKNMEKWQWGDYHQIYFPHPLATVKPLNLLFNQKGRISVGGSAVTVQAAAFREDGTVNHGGSWRFVIDMNKQTTGYHLVGPGQSGHVFHKWYQNQLKNWVTGDYHETKLHNNEGKTLRLKPKAH
ncbi:penicillin acylase family protein [Robertmurraya sp. DFI.2.37]|uniref:penicillin acylase family protein n=1 Tax=Robertmurraya sp. DFI.2.37 TaxID=3031819 RepID=UPI001246CD38|nr:penicillin acylase family protein [Robertmurraya sp. DFI.2.37]MDF1509823.1 penicillin acylase family protein [Robertmurraya sp. DFI.2.37]